jgi:hypothetical protein
MASARAANQPLVASRAESTLMSRKARRSMSTRVKATRRKAPTPSSPATRAVRWSASALGTN